jgi:signal transduction histidine kinase
MRSYSTDRPSREGRHQWLTLGFLSLALLLTGILAYHAYAAQRSHERAEARAMHGYAQFAAWELAGHVRDNILSALYIAFFPGVRLLPRANSGHVLPVARFSEAVRPQGAQCECLDGAITFVHVDFRTGQFETEPAAMTTDARVRWVRDSIINFAHALPPLARTRPERPPDFSTKGEVPLLGVGSFSHHTFFARADDTAFAVAFVLGRRHDGSLVEAYGYVAPASDFLRPVVGRVLAGERLLPPALTGARANAAMLAVQVATPGGDRIYRDSTIATPYVASDTLPRAFGSLRLTVALDPALAKQLLLDTSHRSRLPMLLALFLLIAGLVGAAAVQVKRQEDLVRLRSDFVAGVSHELRTPLAQIRLLVELLRRGRPATEEGRQRSLRIIEQETHRLTFLVQNILTFSRRPRGSRRALTRVPVRLATEITDTIEAFRPLAEAHRARIELEVPDVVKVMLDSGAFRQILVNLLDNAVRYGPPGQTIRLQVSERAGAVRVAITDQGPGIPPNERKRIWEPYYRIINGATAATGGSGLGLSVVADLVALHGGHAWVEDAPEGGACFVIELPAVERDAAPAPASGIGTGAERAEGWRA